MESEIKHFQIVIRPKNSLLDFKLKEIFHYRDLISLFVKRDFISKYKQTILGPAWAVIQPLLTTVVFTILFGSLANLTTADTPKANAVIPGFLFYMAGTICWTYFSTTVNNTSATFINNAGIMGKVYFPRMVTPISIAFSNLIQFTIQLIMFVAIYIVMLLTGTAVLCPSWYLFLLPFLVLQMMMLSMGFGIIISALTTKYRDLQMLVGFGLQLWQYATPIAYGLRLVPEKWQWLMLVNPVTPIVLTFRYAFFGTGYFSLTYYLISWVMTIGILLLGMILFNRIEKTFMDTI